MPSDALLATGGRGFPRVGATTAWASIGGFVAAAGPSSSMIMPSEGGSRQPILVESSLPVEE